MAAIVIPGLTPSFKLPKAVVETLFGRGRQSVGAIPLKLLVTGTALSGGTATPDQDILRVYSEEEADVYFGAGSEIAIQCYHALAIPGVNLYAAPVAEAGGATAAELEIKIDGTWTGTGTLTVFLSGKAFSVTVTGAMDEADVAEALAAVINGDSRLFCTAEQGEDDGVTDETNIVFLTVKSKGARGNDWICRVDLSAAPAGLTCTLTGGTELHDNMTPFAGGAGADSVANLLALLKTDVYDFIAFAQNDTTNAALIRTHLNSEIGPLVMHPENAIVAKTGAPAASMSFASTTVNHQLMTVVHLTNCELAPSAIAAQVAAIRATTVGANPNFRYNGVECPTIPPQAVKADLASDSQLDAMLNSGVMPLTTTPDGRVVIVRAIQSHCMNGSSPDYRTLDWGHVDVPIRMGKEFAADWELFSANNPYVGDDPAPGAQPAPEGVATPTLWNAQVYARLKAAEAENWVQDVDANPPLTIFDPEGDRLLTAVPVVVRLQNHQVGISVRQTAA